MSYIYLASPYSHHDKTVCEERFQLACKAAALLMRDGYVVFSPIAHSHPIAEHLYKDNHIDGVFWHKQDLPLLEKASRIIVLCIPGWESSKGVSWEINYANMYDISILYMYLKKDNTDYELTTQSYGQYKRISNSRYANWY